MISLHSSNRAKSPSENTAILLELINHVDHVEHVEFSFEFRFSRARAMRTTQNVPNEGVFTCCGGGGMTDVSG